MFACKKQNLCNVQERYYVWRLPFFSGQACKETGMPWYPFLCSSAEADERRLPVRKPLSGAGSPLAVRACRRLIGACPESGLEGTSARGNENTYRKPEA